MSFEATTQMAKSADRLKKPEKSQEELREAFEQKLNSLKPTLQEGIKEYQQALEDGVFDDQDGEPAGTGEIRKEALQKKLTNLFDRAEKMKIKLDSKEPLQQTTNEISTTYNNPDGKKENITLDFEVKLQDFTSFYQKNNIDLPADFEDSIRDIWDRNQTEIEQAIEQGGFEEMLIVPENISISEIKDKMTMESGYYEYSNFQSGGSFAGTVSKNTDKPRIILVHKTKELTDRPEMNSTLNTKGQDVKLDQALTLEDYIIFQKKYFEDTGKHLDETKWTWLATKSGARLVCSGWDPGNRRLAVDAYGLGYRSEYLGVRPARCFF